MKKAWKVFEDGPNRRGPTLIMRGLRGSRDIPLNTDLTAEKRIVRDGSGKNWYESGFHVYKTIKLLKQFVATLKIKKDRVAAKVAVSELRPKGPRSRASLCDQMRVCFGDWVKRIPIEEL